MNYQIWILCIDFSYPILKTFSTRFLISCWWIFALVILLTYALTLKTFISVWSVTSTSKKADTVSQLLKDEEFRFAVLHGGSSQAMLEVNMNLDQNVALVYYLKFYFRNFQNF